LVSITVSTTVYRLPSWHRIWANACSRNQEFISYREGSFSAALYARHSGLVINLELGESTTKSDLFLLARLPASLFDLSISLPSRFLAFIIIFTNGSKLRIYRNLNSVYDYPTFIFSFLRLIAYNWSCYLHFVDKKSHEFLTLLYIFNITSALFTFWYYFLIVSLFFHFWQYSMVSNLILIFYVIWLMLTVFIIW